MVERADDFATEVLSMRVDQGFRGVRRALRLTAFVALAAVCVTCGCTHPAPQQRLCTCAPPPAPDRVVVLDGASCRPFRGNLQGLGTLFGTLTDRVVSIGQTPANEMPLRLYTEQAGAGTVTGVLLVYDQPVVLVLCGHARSGHAPGPGPSAGEEDSAWRTRPVDRVFIPLAPGPDPSDPLFTIGDLWFTGPDYGAQPATGPEWDLASVDLDGDALATDREIARVTGLHLQT
jgi:hypothetical protein